MSSVVVRVEVVGILLDPSAVPFDQGLRTLGEMFEVRSQGTIIDLERGQRRQIRTGRIAFRKGRRIPVEAHLGQLPADGPQVPNVRAGRFVGRYDQARAIGAESGRHHAVLVWAFEPRQRAAGLDLDQPEDLAGVLDDPKPAVGGEAAKPLPIGLTSRQLPTSHSRLARSTAISRRG